jgi:hypothetical protein
MGESYMLIPYKENASDIHICFRDVYQVNDKINDKQQTCPAGRRPSNMESAGN